VNDRHRSRTADIHCLIGGLLFATRCPASPSDKRPNLCMAETMSFHAASLMSICEALGIEIDLGAEPALALPQDVGPVLLYSMASLFLRVIPCRAKKRCTVPMPTGAPRLVNCVWISTRVMSPCSASSSLMKVCGLCNGKSEPSMVHGSEIYWPCLRAFERLQPEHSGALLGASSESEIEYFIYFKLLTAFCDSLHRLSLSRDAETQSARAIRARAVPSRCSTSGLNRTRPPSTTAVR
jgi:hypothetical protein